ncbi:MAG: 3-phosphoshikimate 1-carboxyvinyltransferase [Acutalibacteraceae bacterium]|nr:3-phosphoshikimate 1-carboxyvinyltransferase [Acutalibacteraceae bacterium]
MIVNIEKGTAKGRVTAPPSKSMAHRNLICGALSNGSLIKNIADSQDIIATAECIGKLGAIITKNKSEVKIGGFDPYNIESVSINCRESGSTLRFLLPLCLLCDKEITLYGSGRLLERPMTVYEKLCKEKGIYFYQDGNCIKVKGKLSGGIYTVDSTVSSQFISGLLFALPLLKEDSVIKLTGMLQSESYLRMTLSTLEDFGIEFDATDINNIKIKGNQKYIARELTVEGDFSNSAFLHAFNLFGGEVTVNGLLKNSLQGDKVYLELFEKLNEGNPTISLADCPDLGPILFCVAAAKNGAVFTDTARLRIKESDRVACMVKELSKFGVKTEISDNSVKIFKGGLNKPIDVLYSHNDHRIAMSLSVLLSLTGGRIEDAQAVNKSFPEFFELLSDLGIKVKISEA